MDTGDISIFGLVIFTYDVSIFGFRSMFTHSVSTVFIHLQKPAIFKTGNGESGNGNGEWESAGNDRGICREFFFWYK